MSDKNRAPNILLLLSDDQGAWALGAAGNSEILTPNLDALAERGVLFEQFYCASPVCSPARASLLTGQMPSVHGVHDWIRHTPEATNARFIEHAETFVENLHEAGYRTGMFGKWHLGDASTPAAGFESWFAFEGSHGPYQDAEFRNASGQRVATAGYITDVIADAAIDFVSTDDFRPFYASVHFTAPHHPWVDQGHPQHWLDAYESCAFESCPQERRHPWIRESSPAAIEEAYLDPRPSLQGYFAAVSAMDEAIGRIVHALEQTGELGNTVILFTSDNGYSCGQHGVWGKGNATTPLNLFENSVRVPTILVAPEVHAHRCPTLASAYDLYPTFLSLAGAPAELVSTRPGRDVSHADGRCPAAESVVVCDEYGDSRMIRNGPWKFVSRSEGTDELYNLERDPAERHNLVGDRSLDEFGAELCAELDAWFARHAPGPYDGRGLGVTGAGQNDRLPVPSGSAFETAY